MHAWRSSVSTFHFFDVFAEVSESDIYSISHQSELREYVVDEVLVEQNETSDWVYFIISGVVGLFKNTRTNTVERYEPNKILVQVLKANDAIGDAGLLMNFSYRCTIKAITEIKVLAIQKAALAKLALSNMSVSNKLMNRVSAKFLDALEAFDKTQGHVSERIDILAKNFSALGIDINQYFTKTQIAEMLGVSRVSVSTVLNHLDVQSSTK